MHIWTHTITSVTTRCCLRYTILLDLTITACHPGAQNFTLMWALETTSNTWLPRLGTGFEKRSVTCEAIIIILVDAAMNHYVLGSCLGETAVV